MPLTEDVDIYVPARTVKLRGPSLISRQRLGIFRHGPKKNEDMTARDFPPRTQKKNEDIMSSFMGPSVSFRHLVPIYYNNPSNLRKTVIWNWFWNPNSWTGSSWFGFHDRFSFKSNWNKKNIVLLDSNYKCLLYLILVYQESRPIQNDYLSNSTNPFYIFKYTNSTLWSSLINFTMLVNISFSHI